MIQQLAHIHTANNNGNEANEGHDRADSSPPCGFTTEQPQVPQDPEYFLYGAPLYLRDLSGREDYQKTLASLAYAATFNLSLTLHFCSMQEVNSPIKQRQLLQKAAGLYRLVYDLQVDMVPHTPLEAMAVLNNIAHVLSSLGELKQSEECSKHLLKSLMRVVRQEHHGEGAKRVFHGFLGNVLPLMLGLDKPPAAAA